MLLMATACNADYAKEYDLNIDNAFTDQQIIAIIDSANEWSYKSNNDVVFNVHITDSFIKIDKHSILIRSSNQQTVAEKSSCADCLGYCLRDNIQDSSTIDMPIDSFKDSDIVGFSQAVKHEIGHALGLKHAQPGNIMSVSKKYASVNITCDDVTQLHIKRNEKDNAFDCKD